MEMDTYVRLFMLDWVGNNLFTMIFSGYTNNVKYDRT